MSVFTLTILQDGTEMDPNWQILGVDVQKEFNRIPRAEIVLLDGGLNAQTFEISDADFFAPANEIEIKVRYESDAGSEATIFKGLVTKQRVAASMQGMRLNISLKDAASKLSRVRKRKVFREKTDSTIFSDIIGEAGLTDGAGPDTSPEHLEILQYNSTDWDFMLTRAEANGLLLLANDGEVSWRNIELTGSAVDTFELGLSEIYDLDIEADIEKQLGSVGSTAWDIASQALREPLSGEEATVVPGNLDGAALGEAIGGGEYTLTSTVALAEEELQSWANSKLARSRLSMIVGTITLQGRADILVGDLISIAGIGERFNGDCLVTGIRHQIGEQGWQTTFQIGLRADVFAEKVKDITDAPASGLLPAVHGLQLGLVEAFEEDPNGDFRIKLKVPAFDAEDGLIWARWTMPDAGTERGFFFMPEIEDEVVIGFLNDDPRQAVVLGSLYSSVHTPPVADINEDNFHKGIFSREGIQITFDDEKKILTLLTSDNRKVVLDEDAGSLILSDDNDNTITMDSDGILIKSAGDIVMEADGNVEIKGSQVDVQ